MARITANAIKIANFKGVRDLEIQFGPGQTDIYGDNATGKTTVADAFAWALFGRDSHNQAAFGIKPLAANGEVADHGFISSVELALTVDGEAYTLRKEYREKWTKKRGSRTEVLSGHETKCFVDGIPKTVRDYAAFIEDLIKDEETFRIQTDPEYFPAVLDWKTRRSILMKLAGEISPKDVAATNPEEFEDVLGLIEKHGVADALTKLKADRTRLNKARAELPIRIDEAMRVVRDDIDIESERAALFELNSQIAALDVQIAEMSADTGNAAAAAEVRSQIASLVREDEEARAARTREWTEAYARYTEEASAIRERLFAAESEARRLDAAIETLTAHVQDLRSRYVACARERWTEDTVCPTCGQTLPDTMVAEKRAQWNKDHSRKLEELTAAGKAQVAQLDAAEKKQRAMFDVAESERAELTALVEPAKPADEAGSNAEHIAELRRQLEKLTAPGASAEPAVEAVRKKRAGLVVKRSVHQENIAAYEAGEKVRKRIEEFRADEKTLAGQIEMIDAQINACEEFTRTHAALVEKRINGMFRIARFRLFREQVNGGIEDCCDLTANGVPWNDLNSAMRINAGLDVIRTLGEYTGMHAPVFVDNAEGVTQIEDPGSQLIRLVVSEPDKTLRVQEVA